MGEPTGRGRSGDPALMPGLEGCAQRPRNGTRGSTARCSGCRLPEPEAVFPDGPAPAPLRHPQIPGDGATVSLCTYLSSGSEIEVESMPSPINVPAVLPPDAEPAPPRPPLVSERSD